MQVLKKVILTAPGKNEDVTIVMGVNESRIRTFLNMMSFQMLPVQRTV